MSFISTIKLLFSSGGGVKDILTGVGDLSKDIRAVVTGKMDPEKKAEILLKTAQIDMEFQKLASTVIIAEAQGSWLQKNWRPITMLTFLILVVLHSFNLLKNPIADQMWVLLQIGLGGYVAGRSGEKIVKSIKNGD